MHRIECREAPGRELELWANRDGTPAEARASAEGLLLDLRAGGKSRATVYVDGKRIVLAEGVQ